MVKHNIALFASGAGTNAGQVLKYFSGHPSINVALVVSNREKAGVHEVAKTFGVPSVIVPKSDFYDSNRIVEILQEFRIDFVVLAGFLLKIPEVLVRLFPNKMINIHPALLPKFGGHGMYGNFVHQAVKDAGETESGITIHYVNENYDEGNTIFQASCPVLNTDDVDTIRRKVQELEHQHFAPVIEKLLLGES